MWLFVKKHLTPILLGFIAIFILGDFLIRVYFWTGYKLKWDYSGLTTVLQNINNLFTPIAAIISVYLFTRISKRQSEIAERQNEIALSDTLRIHIDVEIEEMESKLTEKTRLLDQVYPGLIDSLEELFQSHLRLLYNEDYKRDIEQVRSGIKLSISTGSGKSYYKDINHFIRITQPIYSMKMNHIKTLVTLIKSQNIIEEEKTLLLNRIKNRYVSNFRFIYTRMKLEILYPNPMDYGNFEIKDWQTLFQNSYKEYFDFFEMELYSDKMK